MAAGALPALGVAVAAPQLWTVAAAWIVLTVGLMLAGIAIVGTTTALVVSVLGEQLALRKDALVHPGAADSQHGPDRPREPGRPPTR